jgi:hypothetical protein
MATFRQESGVMTEQELAALKQYCELAVTSDAPGFYAHELAVGVSKLIAEIRSLQNEVRRLQKQIADAPICYGRKYGTGWLASGEHQQPHDTHTMKLVEIKKIGDGE